MRAARIAGGAQPELARRVRAQHVTEQHAGVDEFAVARRDAFVIERCAGQCLQQVRPLRQREPVREHPLAGRFEQERRATVLAAAADRADEVTDESARDVRRIQHRRLHRRELARAEPADGALARAAADARRRFQLAPVAHRAVPVVTLHLLAFGAEHRAADAVHRAGIRREKAERIAVRAQAAMRADRRAFGIGDAPGSTAIAAASHAIAMSQARSGEISHGCERSRLGHVAWRGLPDRAGPRTDPRPCTSRSCRPWPRSRAARPRRGRRCSRCPCACRSTP